MIPYSYQFKALGTTLNDKVFLTLATTQVIIVTYCQLVLLQFPGAIISSLIGMISGALYRCNFLGIARWRLPMLLQRIGEHYLVPILGTDKERQRGTAATPEEMNTYREAMQANRNVTQSLQREQEMPESMGGLLPDSQEYFRPFQPPTLTPPEESIETLTSMFPDITRERAAMILMENNNNIQQAVVAVLDTMPSSSQ